MPEYVSERGREELKGLRIGKAPDVTGTRAPVELLACVPSEECGCPEEIWQIEGIIVLIHMEEADGIGEGFFFGGDFEYERRFECSNMNGLRAAMFNWLSDQEHGEAA